MTANSPFDSMSLDSLEEVSGELHRRAGVALRRIGDLRADELINGGVSPRQQVAGLIATLELACISFEALIGQAVPPSARSDRHPSTIAAVMYGAPALTGLLARLEQDRRMITSLTRHLKPRLSEQLRTAWGADSLRHFVVEFMIAEPAKVAQSLEEAIAALEQLDPRTASGERTA